ncbi:anthrax toxin lethal factor-related metalloendopeptidase [Neobacillus jeddahensis]|uniref:anthrax toxin lethal factor-related metalloendopeptidase n=1 Tax=Neobacillus jeddahensis TaxID=1461580 RepID=UPI00058DB6A3|nr:hypothetical protein [Neobacillus jeddahensis]
MRKWVVAVVVAGLFLSSITTSDASFDGIMLGDFPQNTELYQSLKSDQSVQLVKQIIVLPQQSFDQKEAAAIISRIDSLPRSLLEKLTQHGVIVKLFTGKLTDNPTVKHLAGIVPRGYQSNLTWDDVPGIGGSKLVLVKIGSSNDGTAHGSVNLELHELAHTIDHYLLGKISDSDEFQIIWENEHEKLFPGNDYFFYQEEYFAECFAMYNLNKNTREKLLEKAPKTFEFMKELQ